MSNNHEFIKLYQKAGFKMIHLKKDFYGNNRSALIFEKKISDEFNNLFHHSGLPERDIQQWGKTLYSEFIN